MSSPSTEEREQSIATLFRELMVARERLAEAVPQAADTIKRDVQAAAEGVRARPETTPSQRARSARGPQAPIQRGT